jgi:RimJ/RimL family protein N-acetyltransferase/GNAT superfamily N-acetyltransferase
VNPFAILQFNEENEMKSKTIRPGEPERDFAQMAAWFSIMEDEPTTETKLKEYFEKEKKRIIQQVIEDEQGELAGFYWMVHDRLVQRRASFDLFVRPEKRGCGTGSLLYEGVLQAAKNTGVKNIRVNISDIDKESLTFAGKRGFKEQRHEFLMCLDLKAFDDQPYNETLARLKEQGFIFSSMEALGDSEENQRKLFALNDTAAASTPGTNGEHPWGSIEDFQKRVCQAEWYKPGGQIMAIDSANGKWAAMSAITRLEGNEHAYNLFTGVDMGYRGRKLGQAVKVLALRYAREVLKVGKVRTNHNTLNAPMIAIDRKFGYTAFPGIFIMEKSLE